MRNRRPSFVASVLVLVLVAAGCGGGDDASGPKKTTTTKAERTTTTAEPTSTTAPGTRPPPSTRSNSLTPVGRARASCASTSMIDVAAVVTGPATVVEVVEQVTEWPAADVRTLLAKYGLKADHVNRPAASLSPGERTRASLALLQAVGVNLLVLDEPTNHLDLPAIEQLEQALATYDGTLLLVSHDRRMLANVTLDQRWDVDGGRVTAR